MTNASHVRFEIQQMAVLSTDPAVTIKDETGGQTRSQPVLEESQCIVTVYPTMIWIAEGAKKQMREVSDRCSLKQQQVQPGALSEVKLKIPDGDKSRKEGRRET